MLASCIADRSSSQPRPAHVPAARDPQAVAAATAARGNRSPTISLFALAGGAATSTPMAAAFSVPSRSSPSSPSRSRSSGCSDAAAGHRRPQTKEAAFAASLWSRVALGPSPLPSRPAEDMVEPNDKVNNPRRETVDRAAVAGFRPPDQDVRPPDRGGSHPDLGFRRNRDIKPTHLSSNVDIPFQQPQSRRPGSEDPGGRLRVLHSILARPAPTTIFERSPPGTNPCCHRVRPT